MIERRVLKERAREQIKGNIGILFLCYLIMIAIIGGLAFVPFVGTIGLIFVEGPFILGMYMIYLAITYGEKPQVGDVFKGFSENFGTAVLTNLLIGIFTFLWSLLFVVPGIIKAFSYSMSFYILAENPQMSATEAITESRRLMDGHKMEYFVLILSFIPWMLLGTITAGLAYIYVGPYMQVTVANFYQELKRTSMTTIEGSAENL